MKPFLILIVSLSIYLYSFELLGDSSRERSSASRSSNASLKFPSRPKRLDTPLRYPNISDEEVRQVKAAVMSVHPGTIANIGGVVEGCPCEDGPLCTSQVWVVAYSLGKYDGLMLSKIEGEWRVGPVQRWWHLYDALRIRMRDMFRGARDPSDPALWDAYDRLMEEQFRLLSVAPSCSAEK